MQFDSMRFDAVRYSLKRNVACTRFIAEAHTSRSRLPDQVCGARVDRTSVYTHADRARVARTRHYM